jgi:hypothetical protein
MAQYSQTIDIAGSRCFGWNVVEPQSQWYQRSAHRELTVYPNPRTRISPAHLFDIQTVEARLPEISEGVTLLHLLYQAWMHVSDGNPFLLLHFPGEQYFSFIHASLIDIKFGVSCCIYETLTPGGGGAVISLSNESTVDQPDSITHQPRASQQSTASKFFASIASL